MNFIRTKKSYKRCRNVLWHSATVSELNTNFSKYAEYLWIFEGKVFIRVESTYTYISIYRQQVFF